MAERRWERYEGKDAALLEEEHKRAEMDRTHNRLALRVHHHHVRSSSRCSDSSTKAEREMDHIEADIGQNNMVRTTYTRAVDAIDEAAVAANHGRAPTGEGVDFVRAEIKHALDGTQDFIASRGARNAAANIINV